jgi:Fungal protein kinase
MAADLVQDSKIPQTIIHDLESFFWVLVWIVLMQVKISWTDQYRSGIICQTMNLKVYYGSGAVDKNMFLTSTLLTKGNLQIDRNPTLRGFLEALRILVFARYVIQPTMMPDTPFDPIQYNFSDSGKKKNKELKKKCKSDI